MVFTSRGLTFAITHPSVPCIRDGISKFWFTRCDSRRKFREVILDATPKVSHSLCGAEVPIDVERPAICRGAWHGTRGIVYYVEAGRFRKLQCIY